MNLARLKEAEGKFFALYPGGVSNPAMVEIAKKHKAEKMTNLAQESFSIEQFEYPHRIIEAFGKIVSQSSMISLFEKPKFRDVIKSLNEIEKIQLSSGLKEFLHGNQALGFKLMVDILSEYKLAKWTLMTICPIYFNPSVEVFIKPTTTKKLISYFELEPLKYHPKPSYEFYKNYRAKINEIKMEVDTSLRDDNAAFCGIMMMIIGGFDK